MVASFFIDVPKWADNYIGYLYSKGLAKSTSASAFGANDKCTVSMYTTFVLRALGYSDTMDFTYNNSLDFAVEIGLLDQSYENYLSDNQLLREYKDNGRGAAYCAIQEKTKLQFI